MKKDVKIIRCPICNRGHIADIPNGIKFKIYDVALLPKDTTKKVVILKCPKEPHYAALEIV